MSCLWRTCLPCWTCRLPRWPAFVATFLTLGEAREMRSRFKRRQGPCRKSLPALPPLLFQIKPARATSPSTGLITGRPRSSLVGSRGSICGPDFRGFSNELVETKPSCARVTPPDQIQVLSGAFLWYSGRRLRENVAVRDYARFHQGEFGTQYVVSRKKDTRHRFQWLDWFRGRRAF